MGTSPDSERSAELLVLATLYDVARQERLVLRAVRDALCTMAGLTDAAADRALRTLLDRGHLAVGAAADRRLHVSVTDEGVDWLATRLW